MQAQYNEEGAENALLRPALSMAMARPLYEVYSRRFATGATEAGVGRARRRRRAGVQEDVEEAAPAQEAAAPEEAADAPPQSPMGDAAPADFDQPPMGMPQLPLAFQETCICEGNHLTFSAT